MLTTIPFDKFMELVGEETNESNASKKSFKWATMLKHSSKLDELERYVSTTNAKYIGEGSARIACFLPPGSVAKKIISGPSCFKIAISKGRGVAQNKAEIKMLEKYKGQYVCMPKLYAYDEAKYHFLLCEVGTPADGVSDTFAEKCLAPLRTYLKKYLKKHPLPKDTDIDDLYFDLGKAYAILDNILEFFTHLKDYIVNDFDRGGSAKTRKADKQYVLDLIKNLKNDLPAFSGLSDVLKYVVDHQEKEMALGDFETSSNWAFVKRESGFVFIPIDWGFTIKVADRYY